MHADWLTLPDTSGLPFAELQATTTVSLLADYRLLVCSGTDSAKFLQGQLTCNLQDIHATQARPGAHCTPKGRMVASFLLAALSEQGYALRTHRDTLTPLQQSLGKYIVFSKATLRDASDEFLLLGLQGPDAEQTVADLFGTAPSSLHGMQTHDNGSVIRMTTEPRFECWIPVAASQAVWRRLTEKHTISGPGFWHWLNIRDGLGEVRGETVEEFIPQMLNMQLTDGISFTKGCYTGQEIVARMQYRGTLKKNAYRIAGTGAVPVASEPVFHGTDEQASGHIVMAEAVGPDQWEALAVIQHDALEHPLHTATGQAIRLLPLPYSG